MNKNLILITVLLAIFGVAQANISTTVENRYLAVATTENEEFVAIKIEDLPEDVQKNIKALLYEEGFMLKEIYQHKENGDIKVLGVSNEASVVTFWFDKTGKEKE
jgi:uncharacterized pyridoxamine 5'-phosphate oxidase family protein